MNVIDQCQTAVIILLFISLVITQYEVKRLKDVAGPMNITRSWKNGDTVTNLPKARETRKIKVI